MASYLSQLELKTKKVKWGETLPQYAKESRISDTKLYQDEFDFDPQSWLIEFRDGSAGIANFDDLQQQQRTEFKRSRIVTNFQNEEKKDIRRFSPPNLAVGEGLQVNTEIMLMVGGYVDEYKSVSRAIQFFNITSQKWFNETIDIPKEIAETHQGITYDYKTSMLYIISGQRGPGCMPATSASARLNLETGEIQPLPPLPMPRYSPGVVIVTDPHSQLIKHLHVFGGASESRNQSATDHWRLVIDERDGSNIESLEWEILEPLPDGGTHGVSFVSSDGYIHYTAFCTLNPGVIPSPSTTECHSHTSHTSDYSQQPLYHVSGLGYRYPTAFSSTEPLPHWERIPDMPFSVCQTGFAHLAGKFYVISFPTLTPQSHIESTPDDSLPVVQAYDPSTATWSVYSFTMSKRSHLFFFLSTWIDFSRKKLFSLHSGNSIVIGDISEQDN